MAEKRQSTSKNGSGYPFILEMLLVTLFFSLSAAVLIQVFTAAKLQSNRNTALNNGLLAVQSGLESARAAAQNGEIEDSNYWYDESWNLLQNSDDATFSVHVSVSETSRNSAGVLLTINAQAFELSDSPSGKLLPSLSSGLFLPAEEVPS